MWTNACVLPEGGSSTSEAAKFALCVIGGFLIPTSANAIVTDGLPPGVTVSPTPFEKARSSDESNVDIGNQSPTNVGTVLASAAWFDTPLTFVGGGSCGASPNFANGCSAFENGTKGGTSNIAANVYGVHYGNNFIAVLYSRGGLRIRDQRFEQWCQQHLRVQFRREPYTGAGRVAAVPDGVGGARTWRLVATPA